MNDQAIEQEIKAKGLTAPRVTPADIEANSEIGRKIARNNAVNKIWPLMGYALKEKLAESEKLAWALS